MCVKKLKFGSESLALLFIIMKLFVNYHRKLMFPFYFLLIVLSTICFPEIKM